MSALSRVGRFLFSLAILGIGLETLICANASDYKVVPVIPWLSAIPILAYSAGIIFGLCGLGLLSKRTFVVASILLGAVMVICGLAFDLPRHFDLMGAPWRTNVLEPIAIGCLAWLAIDGIPIWLRCISIYFLAVALIIFGIGHFQVLSMIAAMVPKWIPWPTFWTLFFGVAFIVAGVSFATGLLKQWASLALGLMFALWLLTIHLPLLLKRQTPDNWSDVFIVAALWGGFWSLICPRPLSRSE
jgi:uncharacterized membrane protein